MKYYAIIDTNVIVSSFITRNDDSPTVSIVQLVLGGKIVPVISSYLLDEYEKILSRPEFGIPAESISLFLRSIVSCGIQIEPSKSNIILPDMKDLPIYEIALDSRDVNSYLVTGNIKHFPKVPFVVTPKEMLDIIKSQENE